MSGQGSAAESFPRLHIVEANHSAESVEQHVETPAQKIAAMVRHMEQVIPRIQVKQGVTEKYVGTKAVHITRSAVHEHPELEVLTIVMRSRGRKPTFTVEAELRNGTSAKVLRAYHMSNTEFVDLTNLKKTRTDPPHVVFDSHELRGDQHDGVDACFMESAFAVLKDCAEDYPFVHPDRITSAVGPDGIN